jgi:hypothetical protein
MPLGTRAPDAPRLLPRPARWSLAVACVGAALSVVTALAHDWVPLDEGTIALTALRTLEGALPHRDYLYPYTGGLIWWHALAMRVFGVSLLAPRYALFIAFLAWIPAFWWLARRVCDDWWAAVTTIVVSWWSLVIYPAAMSSWYVLFCATWALVALVHWDLRGSRRALFAAGVACGLAIACKQTGLYALAATLLGVLLMDQARQGASSGEPRRADPVVVLGLAAVGALVVRLFGARAGASGELLRLEFPVFAVLAVAAWRERSVRPAPGRRLALARSVAIVLAGVSVPLALLVARFAADGALEPLLTGALSDGVRRIASLATPMDPGWSTLVAAAPLALIAAGEWWAAERWWAPVGAGMLGAAAVLASFMATPAYLAVWSAAVLLVPVSVAALVWRDRRVADGATRDPLPLILAVFAAFLSLNQFPYAAPNYFAYVAPFAALAGVALIHALGWERRVAFLGTTFALYALTALRVGSVHTVGVAPIWWDAAHRLAGPRGGLLVTVADSQQYAQLDSLVRAHHRDGALIAGPELPELYFLSGLPSGLHDAYAALPPGAADTAALASAINVQAVDVVVLKDDPRFAPRLTEAQRAWYVARFPRVERVGTIEVRWR